MKRFGFILPALLIFVALATAQAAPSPAPKDKCPVCGMFVAKYPDWVAAVSLKDSSALFFDGAKDFFTWYHNIKKFNPSRSQASVVSITVRDYYLLKQIDARTAFFVIGSDVYGPMGKELVPFEKLTDAQAFLKDHQGKKILKFNEITPAILKTLE